MAYYSYYQSANPHWGQQAYASQFAQHFTAPPQPSYAPQPNWSGQDYYRAHYSLGNGGVMDSPDINLFDWVWGRVKGIVGGGGVGREEARHWHHRVYGGMVDISSLLPTDLGAAAGYEAFRLFSYHKSIYRQPLMDDREREEEALAGLAIAEATKLWSYCQRPSDKYGRRETCEVAASTAERLFRRSRRRDSRGDRDRDYYEGSTYGGNYDRDRGGDYSSSSDEYDEDYSTRRGKRHTRRRSSASYGTMLPGGMGASGYVGGGAYGAPSYPGQVAFPGAAGAAGYGVAGAGYGAPGAGYGAAPYPMAAQAPSAMYSAAPAPAQISYGGAQPASYAPSYQPAYAPPTAGAIGGLVVPQTRARRASFSYTPGYPPTY